VLSHSHSARPCRVAPLCFFLLPLPSPFLLPPSGSMAVDPRQLVAGFLTLSMFLMLGNMIKHDHFSTAEVAPAKISHLPSFYYRLSRV
jgi:hypothetical protein